MGTIARNNDFVLLVMYSLLNGVAFRHGMSLLCNQDAEHYAGFPLLRGVNVLKSICGRIAIVCNWGVPVKQDSTVHAWSCKFIV